MEYMIVLEDADETACIEAISVTNNLSVTEYMTNICRGWIQNQLRGQYIHAARIADLSELKTALSTTVDKIKAADALKAKGV